MRIAFNFCKQWRLVLLNFWKMRKLLEEKKAENKKATKTAVNVFRQHFEAR
jgi:hypothetical protein